MTSSFPSGDSSSPSTTREGEFSDPFLLYIVDEHEVTHPDTGEYLFSVTADDLQQAAERANSRAAETGDLTPLVILVGFALLAIVLVVIARQRGRRGGPPVEARSDSLPLAPPTSQAAAARTLALVGTRRACGWASDKKTVSPGPKPNLVASRVRSRAGAGWVISVPPES